MVSKGPRRAEPWTLRDTVVVCVGNTHQETTNDHDDDGRSLQGQQTKSETWFEPLGTQPLETRPIGDEEPARDCPTSTGRLLATKVTLSWGDTMIWGPGGKAKGQQMDRVSRRCGLSEGRQPGKQR